MEKIHINDIYRVEGTLDLACELFYICEIGKLLHKTTLKDGTKFQVSIKGITLEEHIKETPFWLYFCLAIREGWLVDADIDIDMSSESSIKGVQNKYVMTKSLGKSKPDELPILFENSNNTYFFSDKKNMSILLKGIEKQTWVSILAFFTVAKYLQINYNHKLTYQLNIMLSHETMSRTGALSYLMLLYDKKEISNWVTLVVVSSTSTLKEEDSAVETIIPFENAASTNQLNYEAWIQEGRDKGQTETKYKYKENDFDYIVEERQKTLKKANIEIGDVVALYHRVKQDCNVNDTNFALDSVDFAVVRKIAEKSIDLEIVHNRKTIIDIKCELVALSKEERAGFDKSIFAKRTTIKTMNLADLGINRDLNKEEYFIVTLDNVEDEVQYWAVNESNRVEMKVTTQQNYLYMLLKDYEIEFNAKKYRKLYMD